MTRPRISVILTTFNGEKWLRRTVQAVLEQSVPADEIVLGDDCSSDGSLALGRELLVGFAGTVRVLGSSRRLGVNGNKQRCLAEITGGVIVDCDQDDRWRRDRIEVALRAFDDDPQALMTFTDADVVDGAGQPSGRGLWEEVGFDSRVQARWMVDPLGVLLRRTVVPGATSAWRRELLADVLPFPAVGWHDEWMALIATLLGHAPVAVGSRSVEYRVHGANSSGVPGRTLRDRLVQAGWPRPEKVGMWEAAGRRVPGGRPDLLERLEAAVAFHRARPQRDEEPLRRLRKVAAARHGYVQFGQGWMMGLHDLLSDGLYGRAHPPGGDT